jgi:hypothetical protein
MVNTEGYAATIAETLHIGAASKKMLALVRAMRDAGAKAYLLSIPVLGTTAFRRHASTVVLRIQDGPQIFLPVLANRYARKICALFGFAWFCFAGVRRSDRVILYNHSIEYLIGSVILVLRGNRAFLDIEDAPRADEQGWQAVIGQPLFYFFNLVTHSRKLIVSHSLANVLRLKEYCVVYGAIRRDVTFTSTLLQQLPEVISALKPVRIHYGGSLTADTGVNLFCETVERLIGLLPSEVCRIEFLITGFGSEAQINVLEKKCAGTAVSIAFHPDLSPAEYLGEFLQCHAALSLKLPESSMAMTTFPSKVVEITSHAVLLISTKASDVSLLFDASNAVLLSEATPTALTSAIMSVVKNLPDMQQVAQRGHERAMQLFESKCVGKRIVDFVMEGNTFSIPKDE